MNATTRSMSIGPSWKVICSRNVLMLFPLLRADMTSPVFLPRWKSKLSPCTCSNEAVESSLNEYWLMGIHRVDRAAPSIPLDPCMNRYRIKRQIWPQGSPPLDLSSVARVFVIFPACNGTKTLTPLWAATRRTQMKTEICKRRDFAGQR